MEPVSEMSKLWTDQLPMKYVVLVSPREITSQIYSCIEFSPREITSQIYSCIELQIFITTSLFTLPPALFALLFQLLFVFFFREKS